MGQKRALPRFPSRSGIPVQVGPGKAPHAPLWPVLRVRARRPPPDGRRFRADRIPVQVGPGKAPHAPLWPVLRARPPADGVSGRTGHNGHRLCLVTGLCLRTSANVY